MYSKELLSGLAPSDIQRILAVEHSDPHSVLGAHPATIRGERGLIVRAFHPEAKQAEIIIDNERIRMKPSEAAGLYWLFLSGPGFPLAYRVCFHFEDGTVWEADTPYRFTPTLGEQDLHYIGQGKHYELYEKLGAHPRELNDVKGTSFAVWAPNAKRVSVIGNFNRWDGRLYPMRSMGERGIWELFVPGIGPGELYKYEIKTAAGELRIKTDPYAFSMQLRPGTASVVWDLNRYQWSDHG